jgi:hypothetical protein
MNARKKKDANEIAHAMVEMIASGNVPSLPDGKDPIAVAMGRRGGLKGGKARAAILTAQQRSDSAKKAARARWRRQADANENN